MDITKNVIELENIQKEIKRNNAKNKELRSRVKELEKNITEFLEEKNPAGAKYNNGAILLESKETRPAKKKDKKKEDVINFFSELGVSSPDKAFNKLQEVQKSSPVVNKKLKFVKNK